MTCLISKEKEKIKDAFLMYLHYKGVYYRGLKWKEEKVHLSLIYYNKICISENFLLGPDFIHFVLRQTHGFIEKLLYQALFQILENKTDKVPSSRSLLFSGDRCCDTQGSILQLLTSASILKAHIPCASTCNPLLLLLHIPYRPVSVKLSTLS